MLKLCVALDKIPPLSDEMVFYNLTKGHTMKNMVLGGVFLSAALSCGFCAQPDTEREAECQLVPMTPFSTSNHAQYARTRGATLQMGSKNAKSLNWSGYAALTNLNFPEFGSVSAVRGEWKVPSVHPSTQNSYSAAWVGIDGYTNDTVEQIGTAQGWLNGHADYYTWFSMYPGPSYELLGFPLNPKDKISAEVSYVGGEVFELIIRNLTQHVYYVVPSLYTTSTGLQRTSAEWILEAPSDDYSILPLAKTSPTPFSHCVATIKGKSGKISSSHWKNSRITMVTSNKTVKAKPTKLFHSGKSFNVTWHHQ